MSGSWDAGASSDEALDGQQVEVSDLRHHYDEKHGFAMQSISRSNAHWIQRGRPRAYDDDALLTYLLQLTY